MNKYALVILVFASLLLTSCSKKGESNEVKNLSLRQLDIISIQSNEFKIGRIEAPLLINEDQGQLKFILYDSSLNQVLVVNSEGIIEVTIGSYGSGPRQFQHITSFGLDKDTLIVYDAELDKVKKFTLDGNYLGSHDGLIKDKIWIRSNRLFEINGFYYYGIQEAVKSNANNHWESKTVAVYDKSGQLIELFGEYDPDLVNSHQLYNYANIIAGRGDLIFTTHRTSPTIQKYDVNTKSLISRFGGVYGSFKVSEERPNITDTREVKNKINTQFSFVGDSFVSKDYFAFYFFNFTDEFFEMRDPNSKENFLHLYDLANDSIIGEVQLPYLPLGMDTKGNIYLLLNDDPDNFQIGIYEFEHS
jgi:hypothetical protein